jgi:phosphoribosylpyrophosphate synthetase
MATLSELEFGSLFSYCPGSTSQKGVLAKQIMNAIKNELFIQHPQFEELPASEFTAKILKMTIDKRGILTDFFSEEIILIPTPRSSLIRKDALWPSLQIAKAMEQEGLGTTKPLLKRIKPVPKSSMVPPESRPHPTDHYESIEVKKHGLLSQKLLLVDDIVTRGHTFLGAAWRLQEVFPHAAIRAFAAMRTVSNESEFKDFTDPVRGRIMYRPEYDDCLRRP